MAMITVICPVTGFEKEVTQSMRVDVSGQASYEWWHCHACQDWHLYPATQGNNQHSSRPEKEDVLRAESE